MRSRFRSNARVALVVTSVAMIAMGGCRLFVDLEGLGDGPLPAGGDGATDGGGDTTTSADGPGNDTSLDVTPVPDVKEEPLPDGGCPSLGGPTPKRITSGATSFCIDTTEVTREQYDAFLKSSPAGGVGECAWKSSAGYTPGADWPYTPMTKDHPVVGVDWCDAKAFCAWSGKRMCGGIGGGPLNNADIALPAKSEFVFACSNGGTQSFPYGNVYSPNSCNGADLAAGRTLPVGSLLGCKGGFPGLSDLSGNVHEWLNGCLLDPDAAAPDQLCSISKSAFTHSAGDMLCTSVEGIERDIRLDEIGFRCCSP